MSNICEVTYNYGLIGVPFKI